MMVYNRYIPDSNGIYRHQRMVSHKQIDCNESAPEPTKNTTIMHHSDALDLGDVLLLCIAILLILEADGDDVTSVIIAIAAFMLLQ